MAYVFATPNHNKASEPGRIAPLLNLPLRAIETTDLQRSFP